MELGCKSCWVASSLSLFWLATTSPTLAQIVQDTTLPNPSLVTPNGNVSVITGGTQAGSNLFHSFREFSVPTSGVASFQQVDRDIENVISRVTGSSVSNIDGLIEVLQPNGTVSSATFFLLNPNGIIFGPNASLNVGGSFLASTASSLLFADGNSFSAINSQTTAPLLTVSVPIGLQFGSAVGSIQVQGARLQVPFGKTLGLVGGNLTLVRGRLTAAGGRIELGSVAGASTSDLTPVQVSLTPTNRGWALGYQGVPNFQDIQLLQAARVSASGQGAGDIQVQGRRITLADGSQITINTRGAGTGGNLAVAASESIDINGTSTSGFPSSLSAIAAPTATGRGGNLTIATRQLLVRDGAAISASTLGSGKGGNLTVQATESVIISGTDNSIDKFGSVLRATVEQGATGDGGNLTIDTPQLIVRDGAQVLTSTFGEGNAGNLTVRNAGTVELIGGVVVDNQFFPSGLFSQTDVGTGGNVLISTGQLIVQDGAEVSTATFGTGNAGELTVQASEIKLFGDALTPNGDRPLDALGLPFVSGLFASTDIGSQGNGGNLTIETDRLSLRDGALVQTSTLGAGDAGDLTIRAKDSVEAIGAAIDGDDSSGSGLLAVSGGIPGVSPFVDATGQAGNLTIETGKLIVQDGAQVAVSSLNLNSDKGAGNLQVTAQAIHLDNRGKLTAETASGNGGNMAIQVQDFLLLRNNSNISTTAGRVGAGGDGGNITIDAGNGFIVAVPGENSDIIANAFDGRGGSVTINAQSIFGLVPRSRDDLVRLLGIDDPTQLDPRLLPTNDITAISQTSPSLNGVVTINTPDVDPSRGLANLSTEVVDASNLIASGCGQAVAQRQSKFVVTGRGGLPDNPSEALSSDTVWSDLRLPTTATRTRLAEASATQPTNSTPKQLVEAQGWLINDKGKVVLTAQAVPVVPHSSWQTITTCPTQ
jgi:filamentous hemagglutinin family protein